MKVIIERTSSWNEKPCKEAVEILVPYWHTRTCTEKYYNEHFARDEGLWRSKGKNHRKVKSNGGLSSENWITRQEEDKKVWGIEVNTLEDVLTLVRKYGSIIVSEYSDNMGKEIIYELEIYDGYRE